jgi:hypothetical protein
MDQLDLRRAARQVKNANVLVAGDGGSGYGASLLKTAD